MLVLTGSGDEAFCAGADLKSMSDSDHPRDRRRWLARAARRPARLHAADRRRSRRSPRSPGWCLAGGLELALWCDLRVGTESAKLGFPERRWGVPLIDGGTQRLPRIVGLGRGLDMILSGRIVEADEALAMGLLTEKCRPGAHLDRALEMAEGLAAFPQQTMLADRRSAIEGFALPLPEALALEAKIGGEAAASGVAGAARFASGEGRGGKGAGSRRRRSARPRR